jgi:hypothetical protein
LASCGALPPRRNASQSDAGGSKANRSTRSHSNNMKAMQASFSCSLKSSNRYSVETIPGRLVIPLQRFNLLMLQRSARRQICQMFLTFNTQN